MELRKLKAILVFLSIFFSVAINGQIKELPFIPIIKCGDATFTGKIEEIKSDVQSFNPISISFYSVLTGDLKDYKIPVNSDGTFRMKIPVESITFCYISSDYYNGINCLIPGEESELTIRYDKDQKKQIEFKNSIGFSWDDANSILDWPLELPIVGDEMITPEVFSQKMLDGTQEIIKAINANNKLTPLARQSIISSVRFSVIFHGLLKYNEYALKAYKAHNSTDASKDEFRPQIPDASYYSFLRSFNLNDPILLTFSFYPMILKQIMDVKALEIPDIGDQQVDLWLNKVKQIMKDKLGFETGTVYDIMVCYAYVKRLNSLNPLSEIQKQNIRDYFRNKSFEEVLFAKNEKVVQEAKTKNKTNIYDLTSASEQPMDSIITKYKGKAIFVDFWATWCGPCLKAMHESEVVRKELESKDVVFLYFADTSSPKSLWEQKVYEIRGEQYYITIKAMDYIQKKYNFTRIPHYLIFDKKGQLKYNHAAFMGNETMRNWIEESL
jgi:Thiol-disulfide isomerase and thioredoxins